MKTEFVEQFLNMILAITAEHDREKLLSMILDTAADIASCDAGTLYLLEEDGLHFCRILTRSKQVRQGGADGAITLPPVAMDERYVCAWSAMHKEILNIPDVRAEKRFDFTGSLEYDRMTGYCTKSMLVVPMTDDGGRLIGVMQMINALDENGAIVPFGEDLILPVSAVASAAAVSITNMQYSAQIAALLDSLVRALSKAIDERSHYTANHTRNMTVIAERFLDWLNESGSEWSFGEAERSAFIMSVWLHDVGKLAVPLEIMDKETRLADAVLKIRERFRVMDLTERIAVLEDRMTEAEYEARKADRKETLARIEAINKAEFLPDEEIAFVEKTAAKTWTDENGEVQPWITEEERKCLSIRKGTLTEKEREVMQSHAAITGKILQGVEFPKRYASVPVWAASHHEMINGKGYPNHIGSGEIPKETRLLTILDVYEALTAKDRPYKKPYSKEKALQILTFMSEEGSLDPEILALFKESRAWEAVL